MSANQHTWKPGQSGNPKGRPKKGDTVTDLLRERIDRGKFVDALLRVAYDGDVPAIKLVLSYLAGPPEGDVPDDARVIEVRYVRNGD